MDWSTEVNIHGTIASVGARLIEGTANKLIGQTFTCIQTKLAAEPVPERAPVAAAAPAAACPSRTCRRDRGRARGDPGRRRRRRSSDGARSSSCRPRRSCRRDRGCARGAAVRRCRPGSHPAPAAPAPAAPAPAAPARLQYLTEAVGSTGVNVYLFGNPETGEAIAIDTGHPSLAWIATQLRARDWRLTLVVSTMVTGTTSPTTRHSSTGRASRRARTPRWAWASIPTTARTSSPRAPASRRSTSRRRSRRSTSSRAPDSNSGRSSSRCSTRRATRRARCRSSFAGRTC